MKKILLALFILVTGAYSQSDTCNWLGSEMKMLVVSAQESTPFERGTYVLLASAVYVSYDYFVYAPNRWRAGTTEELLFRISQMALLGGLTYFLIEKFGWKTGAAFGALYFSWCFDAVYYWMYGRGSWDEVERNKVTWANHTPAGWFENPTRASTLKVQMGIGIALSVSFLI